MSEELEDLMNVVIDADSGTVVASHSLYYCELTKEELEEAMNSDSSACEFAKTKGVLMVPSKDEVLPAAHCMVPSKDSEFVGVGCMWSANEHDDAASFFTVAISGQLFKRIKEVQAVVVCNKMHKACFWDYGLVVYEGHSDAGQVFDWIDDALSEDDLESWWGGKAGEITRVEGEQLCVSDTDVWWEMRPKYGTGHYETCMIPIKELDEFFGKEA